MTFPTIEEDVKAILEENKDARNDDMLLYGVYVASKIGRFVPVVMINPEYRITHGIAPYESVSRVRRWVQKDYPELKATETQIREKRRCEREYRQYARRKKGIETVH